MLNLDVLKKEINLLITDLIKKYDELGMRASGKWANSLEDNITQSENGVNIKIYGNDYTYQLVKGRGPGVFPPIKAIDQWIKDKPIISDIKPSVLAFLIARKIAREGTEYYKQGGTDLIESVMTPERIEKILNNSNILSINVVTTLIKKELKNIA